LNEIIGRFEQPQDEHDSEDGSAHHESLPEAIVTYLYPAECTSIMLTMKALISGFVQRSPDGNDGADCGRAGDSTVLTLKQKARNERLRRRWPFMT